MKIHLERTLATCPKKLLCTTCGQLFEAGKLRALLYSDRGLLQGDVCHDCIKLKPSEIRNQMRDRASLLLQQPCDPDCRPTAHERALELLEVAQEEVKFPTFYHWWFKKLTVISEESQELEAARLGLKGCYGEERSRLQKMLEDDRE